MTATQRVEPLDPSSDAGRQVADGLAAVLADIEQRQAREAAAAEIAGNHAAAHSP